MAAVTPTLSQLLFRFQGKSVVSLTDGKEVGATTFTTDINKTTLGHGTGANKVNAEWSDQYTILTGANVELDLTALAGQHGTVTFSKVKALVIELVTATSGYSLTIGGAASNDFHIPFGASAGVASVGPASFYVYSNFVDGVTVDGTHKALKILNPAGGSAVVNVWILGEGTYDQ